MSAIGGVVDFRKSNINYLIVDKMRSAQTLRGRKSSEVYIDSGVGMFYNSDGYFECAQPMISERGGFKTALAMDSAFFDVEIAMEGYRAYGVEVVGMLKMPFSMALYDGERRILLLARDKEGRKPLYYRLKAGKVFFSSEPKGVLAVEDDAIRVNNEILSAHLTSPVGIYGAADIYSDIFEVGCGECIIFSEIGMSRFFYRENHSKKIRMRGGGKAGREVIDPNFDVSEEDIFSSLDDALVAFDIPQFDVYMPSVCRMLYNYNGKRNGVFQFIDYIKRYNIFYAYEREDRLNSFYGRLGVGVMAKSVERCDSYEGSNKYEKYIDERKQYILENLMQAFFSMDRDEMLFLREVLGDAKLNCVLKKFDNEQIKKENTDQIIRTLGMMYQTVKWQRLRNLNLIKM